MSERCLGKFLSEGKRKGGDPNENEARAKNNNTESRLAERKMFGM